MLNEVKQPVNQPSSHNTEQTQNRFIQPWKHTNIKAAGDPQSSLSGPLQQVVFTRKEREWDKEKFLCNVQERKANGSDKREAFVILKPKVCIKTKHNTQCSSLKQRTRMR